MVFIVNHILSNKKYSELCNETSSRVIAQTVIADMDGHWLACWRSLLLGLPVNQLDLEQLKAATIDVADTLQSALMLDLNHSASMRVYHTIQVMH